MTVAGILQSKGRNVFSIGPDLTLQAAAKLLADQRIGAALVLEGEQLVGILSERDIVRVVGQRGAIALEQPVSSVMTRKVVSCREGDHVSAIMEMMTSGKFRHLPVVEDGKLVGLISIGDIVKWRVREFEKDREALEDYIKTA